MANIRDLANEKNKIKSLTVLAVYATLVLIFIVSVTLLITLAVNHSESDTNVVGGSSGGKGSFTLTYEDTKKGDLLVVNKSSAAFDFGINPETRLVSLSSEIPNVDGTAVYQLRNAEMKASRAAVKALGEMVKDFYEQSADKDAAAKLTVWTAYRSLEAQNSLGSSTKGGYSDFHTGNLFELTYNGSSSSISQSNVYDWIYKNAHKYGFVTRYDESKSGSTGVSNFDNAFKYVGVAHATYMTQNDLCLEEYVEKVHAHGKDNPLEVSAGNATYEIYYVKANTEGETLVKTSSKNGTTISGDNAGGFIVTVKK